MFAKIINQIEELDLETMGFLKNELKDTIVFYSNSGLESSTKPLIEEKVCDYIETFRAVNYLPNNKLCKTYAEILYPYISFRQNKTNKQAFRYLERARLLKSAFDKGDQNITIDNIKDFTRIFICLYKPLKEKEKTFCDADFSFKYDSVDYEYCLTDLKKEKKSGDKYSKLQFTLLLFSLACAGMINDHKALEEEW